MKRIRKVKNFKESNQRLRFLSIEEAQQLISVCDEHLKPIVITVLHTGMRRGVILKLTWDNVDLVHGFITLIETKNGERREIPINETLRQTLNRFPGVSLRKMGKRNLSPISSMNLSRSSPMRVSSEVLERL